MHSEWLEWNASTASPVHSSTPEAADAQDQRVGEEDVAAEDLLAAAGSPCPIGLPRF